MTGAHGGGLPDVTCTACGGVPAYAERMRSQGQGKPPFLKALWICACGAEVGCRRGSTVPLGRPADRDTRIARQRLHELIDPLWRDAPLEPEYAERRRRLGGRNPGAVAAFEDEVRRTARMRVYAFMGDVMGLDEEACHAAMFDHAQCERAWKAMAGVRYADIRTARRKVEARLRGARRRARTETALAALGER